MTQASMEGRDWKSMSGRDVKTERSLFRIFITSWNSCSCSVSELDKPQPNAAMNTTPTEWVSESQLNIKTFLSRSPPRFDSPPSSPWEKPQIDPIRPSILVLSKHATVRMRECVELSTVHLKIKVKITIREPPLTGSAVSRTEIDFCVVYFFSQGIVKNSVTHPRCIQICYFPWKR